MTTERRCAIEGCNEVTKTSLHDFCDIGWTAFQIPKIGIRKPMCFCKQHEEQGRQKLREYLSPTSRPELPIKVQANKLDFYL